MAHQRAEPFHAYGFIEIPIALRRDALADLGRPIGREDHCGNGTIAGGANARDRFEPGAARGKVIIRHDEIRRNSQTRCALDGSTRRICFDGSASPRTEHERHAFERVEIVVDHEDRLSSEWIVAARFDRSGRAHARGIAQGNIDAEDRSAPQARAHVNLRVE